MISPMHAYLSLLIKPASSDCNLFCDYCFYRKTAKDYPESTAHRMSENTLRTIIAKAQTNERKAVSYVWQGGEPMLMGLDFFKIAVEIQNAHLHPNQQITNTIQTNAVNIDDKWASFFRKNDFLVGVSMDGPKELYDTHRFTRAGTSVFEKAAGACETLDKHKVKYNILAVVNNDTVRYPEKIYKYFRSRDFDFLQFIDCFEAEGGEIAPFSVDPFEYGKFLCRLFDLWIDDGYPHVSIRLFDNYLQYRAGMIPECCMYKNNCGEYFVVEHNGDIFPCDFFVTKEWNMGNINTHEIHALIESPVRRKFSEKRSIPHNDCESCRWLGFCRRGCIKSRFLPDLDYSSLNKMCEAYKMFFEHADKTYDFLSWDIMRRHRGELPPDIGRNDPCLCGSGKKYKKCCGKYSFLLK